MSLHLLCLKERNAVAKATHEVLQNNSHMLCMVGIIPGMTSFRFTLWLSDYPQALMLQVTIRFN